MGLRFAINIYKKYYSAALASVQMPMFQDLTTIRDIYNLNEYTCYQILRKDEDVQDL